MITLLVVLCVSFMAFFFSKDMFSRQKTLRSFIFLCLSVAILLVSLSGVVFCKEFVVDNANMVAAIIPEANCKAEYNDRMYYDADNEKYFTIAFNYFNPFIPISRHYVETEQAAKYVEIYNRLAEIKLN